MDDIKKPLKADTDIVSKPQNNQANSVSIMQKVRELFDEIKLSLLSGEAQRRFLSLFIFFIILFAMLVLSILGYCLFYFLYIPQIAHSLPVYFQYYNDIEQPIAEVDLSVNSWRHSGILTGGQYYNVLIELNVPDSQHNYDLGNFMINLKFKNALNETVAYSSRPCIVKYKSFVQKNIETIVKTVPLFFDVAQESQTIYLPLIESYIEDEEVSTTKAILTLSNKSLHLNSAKLNFEARFHGLRYYMYHWKLLTGVLLISVFMFFEIVVTFLLWRSAIRLLKDAVEKKIQ
ncbi:hypothetical protein BCR32DRAFT_215288 [Anaeromyces robustus]|uniref:DUF1226-domain-containing protein n=1 Tax=Anaeromyces robustus TaxID=1754192 RepID=A0A1Y1XP20_9FUNG|nr:hypothetical protein BCR32DRAFT_215288 [Anaeromyces robustus]|eukprot:ORX87499.1 hypothetical protein BCR32DRAFT_215288 [Anaeromyces robustus]